MADNVLITAGTGTTILADELTDATLGSGKAQFVKIMDGTLDSSNKAVINANGAFIIQGFQPAVSTFSGIITAAAQTSVAVTGYNVATVTLRTFTGTTPSVTWKLQAADDNTNWVDLQGINNTTGQVGTSWTQAAALSAGTAGPSVDFTIGAYTNVRINVTAISGASASAAFGLALQSMPYEASPGAICQGLGGSLGNPVIATLGNSTGKTVTMKTGSLVTTAVTADQVVLTYTVTAGKTFYLTYLDIDARLTTFATTATYFGLASLESPSGTKLVSQMKAGAGVTTDPHYEFPEPIPIASGVVIRVVTTPSTTTSYTWQASFGGYEK